jgi:excisionase family DNA binding protein
LPAAYKHRRHLKCINGKDWQSKNQKKVDTSLAFFYAVYLEAEATMRKGVSDEVLTTAETCRYLKVAPRTLYRYIKERRVPAFKLGKDWRFVKSELDLLLRKKSRQQSRA